MARDRKRAKQRQRRRSPQRQPARAPARRPEPEAAPEPLEHSSAEVDLAEAAIVDPPEAELEAQELPQEDELGPDDEHVAAQDAIEEPEPATVRGGDDRAAAMAATGRPTGAELPKEGNRLLNFLRACVAELKRVQWPDRRQVTQATGVVLGFVILAGTYLGVLDALFSRLVGAIL